MVGDDLLAEAVDATLARISAQRNVDAELTRRRLAIWRMHNEQGLSASVISDSIRDALRDRGLASDAIQDLGVGYHSIAKIVKGPRP